MSALLAICAENSPVPGEFPAQRPVTRSFDVFFNLRLNKRLRKQPWGWWFETLSCPLWRHCNECDPLTHAYSSGLRHRHMVQLYDCLGSGVLLSVDFRIGVKSIDHKPQKEMRQSANRVHISGRKQFSLIKWMNNIMEYNNFVFRIWVAWFYSRKTCSSQTHAPYFIHADTIKG